MATGPEARFLFVYGTLMPGFPRWPIVRPFARTIRVDSVPGRIYDNGEGQAAAVFGGDHTIEGWVVELHQRLAERAVKQVARLQGDKYRTAVVRTVDGAEAVAFEWVASVEGLIELPGQWRDPERRTG